MAPKTVDDRLIFYDSPATLQMTAAIALAAQTWRHEITSNHTNFDTVLKSYPRVGRLFEISSNVGKLVNNCIDRMKNPLKTWVQLHHSRIFFTSEKKYDVLVNYFDSFVWSSDCSIDEERTARNLISLPELDECTKYKIATLYCFVSDIRRLWPKAMFEPHLVPDVYKTNPLIAYWDYQMQSRDNSERVIKDGSIESDMIELKQLDTSSALMYCWSRLKPEHLINKAVYIVEKYQPKYVRSLMRSLTKSQFNKLVKKCSENLILKMLDTPGSVEFALQTWYYMKNLMTGDSFAKMVFKILDSKLDYNQEQIMSMLDCVGRGDASSEFEEDCVVNMSLGSLLYRIWQGTQEHLKKYMLDNHMDTLLEKLCTVDHNQVANFSRDVTLLVEVFSKRTVQQNNNFWRKHWRDIIQGVNSARLTDLMRMSFQNDQRIAKFKRSHMAVFPNIEDYCDTLISDGFFKELNEFLRFCSPDRTVRSNLKRAMLFDMIGTIRYCTRYADDREKMQTFDDFISDISPNSEQREDLKRRMVLACGNFNILLNLLMCGFLRPVMKFVRLFLTRQKDFKTVKKNFERHCQSILNQGKFLTYDLQELNEFLCWCVNDNQQLLEQMKKSVPIDKIFLEQFEKSVQEIRHCLSKNDLLYSSEDDDEWSDTSSDSDSSHNLVNLFRACKELHDDESSDDLYQDRFKKLDEILSWYFVSEEKVKQFKLMKINNRRIPFINKVLNCERLAEIALHWFFDGNAEDIEAFRMA